MEGCGKNVRDLPRHLRSKKVKDHGWTQENARAAVSYCNLRKKKEKGNGKDYHHRKICPVGNCKMVVKRLPQHLQTKHKMKPSENYYNVLKQAEKYFDWDIVGSSPKKTISLPVTCCKEQETTSKFTVSLNPCKTPLEPKTPSKMAISISSCKTPVELKKTTFMPLKKYKDIPARFVQSPVATPNHTLVAPKKQPHTLQFSHSNKNNDFSDKSDVQNNVSESSKSELSPFGLDDELSSPICRTKDPDYVPDIAEAEQQREAQIFCSDEVNKVLDQFLRFLKGPDGGHKAIPTATQMVAEVRRMLLAINAFKIEDMFVKNIVRDKYLMDYCIRKRHAAKSVNKYLSSIGDFLSFLQIDQIKLVGVTVDDMISMKHRISFWKRMYKSEADKTFWVKQLDDFDHLISPEQVKMYEDSFQSEKARELFKKFSENDCTVSCNEFWSMRDHLFVCIHFGNGHRSGVSANMMLKEFKKAHKQNGNYIIHVMNHKTIKTSGPAMVTLTETQFKWLGIYVEKIRPQVKPKVDNVFVSWNGLALEPGHISRQIDSLWIKAGIYNNDPSRRKLSCNLIRKSTSTGIRDNEMGLYQETADLMSHSLKTAGMVYAIRDKQMTAAAAARNVRQYFNVRSEINQSADEKECSVEEEGLPGKKKWSVEEESLLNSEFSVDLMDGKINLPKVKKKLLTSPLRDKASSRQVYNKLKSKIRYSTDLKKVSKLFKAIIVEYI